MKRKEELFRERDYKELLMKLRGLASLKSVGQARSLGIQVRVDAAVLNPSSVGQQAGDSGRLYGLENFFFFGKPQS